MFKKLLRCEDFICCLITNLSFILCFFAYSWGDFSSDIFFKLLIFLNIGFLLGYIIKSIANK